MYGTKNKNYNMRSVSFLPSIDTTNNRSNLFGVTASDVKKLTNQCWNHTWTSRTKPPLFRPSRAHSPPTSIKSLPILPSQQPQVSQQGCTQCKGVHHKNKGGPTNRDKPFEHFPCKPFEHFPSITSQCRTKSVQGTQPFSRNGNQHRKIRRGRKPAKRSKQVFVWDHRAAEESAAKTKHQPKQIIIDGDRLGRNIAYSHHDSGIDHSEKGKERMKRRQRTSNLLGMLDKPMILEDLCKTPKPHRTLKDSEVSLGANNPILPPISRESDKPRDIPGESAHEEEFSKDLTAQEPEQKIPKQRRLSKNIKVKKKPLAKTLKKKSSIKVEDNKKESKQLEGKGEITKKEKVDDSEIEEDVEDATDDDDHTLSGTDNDSDEEVEEEEGEDEEEDDVEEEEEEEEEDGDDGDVSMSDQNLHLRVESVLRKSACSMGQSSRFTMSSLEIRLSGEDFNDDSDDDDGDGGFHNVSNNDSSKGSADQLQDEAGQSEFDEDGDGSFLGSGGGDSNDGEEYFRIEGEDDDSQNQEDDDDSVAEDESMDVGDDDDTLVPSDEEDNDMSQRVSADDGDSDQNIGEDEEDEDDDAETRTSQEKDDDDDEAIDVESTNDENSTKNNEEEEGEEEEDDAAVDSNDDEGDDGEGDNDSGDDDGDDEDDDEDDDD